MTMMCRGFTAAVMATLALACGSTSTVGTNGTSTGTGTTGSPISSAPIITIQNLTFSPSNLNVSPGATVTVNNRDANTYHSVTSQSAQGNYVPGSVSGISFDTGLFAGVSTRTFSIPSTAPVGTVIPYFCQNHKQMMANRAQITIVSPSSTKPDGGAGGSSDGGSGGGGTGGGGGGGGY
jgi:plastocyanin